jgi:small multidrug resistance pump
VSWFFLAVAIVVELGATLSLRASDGLRDRRWAPVVVLGYALSFASLSFALRAKMPLSVAYAVWAAIGVAATALLAHVLFRDALNRRMVLGILFIAAGVVLVQAGSSAA